MDAILKSDGTLAIQEVEPLLASLQDTVEGTIVAINPNNQTQFGLVVTDILPAAQSSLIGALHIGDLLTANLTVTPTFFIDSKGLPVLSSFAGSAANFTGGSNTAALHLGQRVAAHVTQFTAASGNTIASCTTDTLTLRWSRLTATALAGSPQLFTISGLPTYFGFTTASSFGVEVFSGTSGVQNGTNLDGVPLGSSPANSPPQVALRALFIEDAGNTLNPAFFAAKIRQR